jgi:hypothetical protein
MLRGSRRFVFKSGEEFVHVSRHGYVHVTVMVVPFEGDAAVESTVPILFEVVVCAEGVDEVVGVLSSFIFDPEVVNGEGELNGSGDVLPEAGRVRDLEVSEWPQTLTEELVCEDACLREAVDCFADF